MRAELDFHVAMTARELEGAGLPSSEARREAERRFGDRGRIERVCTTIRCGTTVASLIVRGRPLFAGVLATAGLAGLAMLADATVLRPAAARVDATLLEIVTRFDGVGIAGVSVPDFRDWDETGLFDRTALFRHDSLALRTTGGARTIVATTYTDGYFGLLRETALIGSLEPPFRHAIGSPAVTGPGDEDHSGTPYVVLSHEIWTELYDADPAILGRPILLDDTDREVIGVLRPTPRRWATDIYLPADLADFPAGRSRRGNHAIARLAAGVTRRAAQDRLAGVSTLLARRHPETNMYWEAVISSPAESEHPGVRRAWALGAVCALALFLACGAAGREPWGRLVADVRLGAAAAGRSPILHAVTRRAIPCVIGFVAAVAAGAVGARLVLAATLPGSTQVYPVRIDSLTLTLALIAAAVSLGAVTGGRDRLPRLAWAGRTAAVFALIVVGIELVGVSRGPDADVLGFDVGKFAAARVEPPRATYPTPETRRRFFSLVVDAVRADPRIDQVALSESVPPTSDVLHYSVSVEGQPFDPAARRRGADRVAVDATYLELLGFDVTAGRAIRDADIRASRPVAVINETMVRRFWPDGGAIGSRFRLGGSEPAYVVIGVVKDVAERGPELGVRPTAYVSFAHAEASRAFVIARSDDPRAAVAAIGRAVATIDPGVPADRGRTVRELIGSRRVPARALGLISGATGILALCLIAVGASRWDVGNLVPAVAGGLVAGVMAVRAARPLMTAIAGAHVGYAPVTEFLVANIIVSIIALGALSTGRGRPEEPSPR